MDEIGLPDPLETPRIDTSPPPETGTRPGRRLSRARLIQIAFLLAGLGLVLAAWLLRDAVPNLETVGYAGVFLLSFLGSAAMVLPVPGLISLCAVSVVLSPFALGMLAATGETIGEISGYAVGYGGRGVVEKSRTYVRIQGWMQTRGWIVIFLVSVIPNPLFDLVGIAAGATRYPMGRFLGIVFAGKTIKGLTIAYTCHYGIKALPWVS